MNWVWCRILLEKRIVFLLVKIFPVFYANQVSLPYSQKLVIRLSWTRRIQYTFSLHISLWTIFISSHLCPVSQIAPFFQGLRLKLSMYFSRFCKCRSFRRPWFNHPENIWWMFSILLLPILLSTSFSDTADWNPRHIVNASRVCWTTVC
jgi:hypothetical protein